MAQEERKAKAVLAAAEAWFYAYVDRASESMDEELDRATVNLKNAVKDYKAVKSAEPPRAPDAFFCPHCGAEKPPYGWNWNGGDTGPFAVAYLTCFCGECKKIISVGVTQFIPQKQLAEEMMKQFQEVLGKKGIVA